MGADLLILGIEIDINDRVAKRDERAQIPRLRDQVRPIDIGADVYPRDVFGKRRRGLEIRLTRLRSRQPR